MGTYRHVPLNFPRMGEEEQLRASREFVARMAGRRSVRSFAPDPVPLELIESAIRCASRAPSGAEIELSMYSRQCLGTRRIPDLATLKRETKAWNRKANQKRTKINWRFTRKKARKVLKYEPPSRRG